MLHHRHHRATGARGLLGFVLVLSLVASILSGTGATTSARAATPARGATASPADVSDQQVNQQSDQARTGWYPNESGLSPAIVSSGTFGQQFSTAVTGKVYAQPLVSGNTLLVVTEANWIYGLDPSSGAVQWSRQLGTPFNASDVACADLAPTIGITGTPVIDKTTNTAYFFSKAYDTHGVAQWYAHAVDVSTGAERPNFPLIIHGSAANVPGQTFVASQEMQRPAMLLMNGVVYAGFGAHCDHLPYQGWVVGVSEAGAVATMWTDIGTAGASGAGIWQSGGGLVSDGPGQILLMTGNGGTNIGPILGSNPPANLGEAAVRLTVQPDGSLKATDFFSPYDAENLDVHDSDFGSGPPVALPSSFGTAGLPHLGVGVGKEGYLYLMNRDNLGGIAEGPHGSDAVIARYGPNGGVWSSPTVWPGDGGYIYVPTATPGNTAVGVSGLLDAYKYGLDGSGNPSLTLAGTSTDAFGFGSSPADVTSSGTASGTALIWTVWSPTSSQVGAQLRAYNPVPVNGHLQLVWSGGVGTSSKFAPPGFGSNKVYVGTSDGRVLGFGSPIVAALSASAVTFAPTPVSQSSPATATFTALSRVTVTSVTTSAPFSAQATTPALPATLAAGATLTVPLTFAPTAIGASQAALTLHTNLGLSTAALTGVGQFNGPELSASTPGLSFGGATPGSQVSSSVQFVNSGSQPLTFGTASLPGAPFSVTGLPANGATLAPQAAVSATVTFSPTAVGTFIDTLTLDSSGGDVDVQLSGSGTPPSVLQISPPNMAFGSVGVGSTVTRSFVLTNVGGSPLTVTLSKPPIAGRFTATSSLPEGTTIPAGQAVVETVAFAPTALGAQSDVWKIDADDGLGARLVTMSGTGVPATGPPGSGGGRPAFFLTNQVLGPATGPFPFGNAGDVGLSGHWSGGDDSYGVYRPSTQTFYLAASVGDPLAGQAIPFGNPGDIPLVGDWDFASIGDVSEIAVYRPSTATFYLRHQNGTVEQITFGDAGDVPITGNWKGTGWGIGVYRPSTGVFFLSSAHQTGPAFADDGAIAFGNPVTDVPIVGEWGGGPVTNIGVYRTPTQTFYEAASNTPGALANHVAILGNPGDQPLVGDWDGDGVDTPSVYRTLPG